MAFSMVLEITALLALWLCLGVWHRDPATPARRQFIGLTLAVAAWCIGAAANARGAADPLTANRIASLGVLTLPALWLGLAARTAGLDFARRMPWFPAVLIAPQIGVYALLWTDAWRGLLLRYHPDGSVTEGPIWWVNFAYCLTLCLIGSAIFIITALRRRAPGQWKQRLALGLASLLPIGAQAAYIATGRAWPHDPTPIGLGIALLALRGALFSGSLLQALPVTQHELIEQLPLGVVITDRHGTVVYVNPAAEARLGIPEARALGRDLDSVLAHGDELTPEISPIAASGRETGQLVLLDTRSKATESA